jgi:predicted nucleic acid-binding protein
VPTLWQIEVINVLLAMEQRNEIDHANTEHFLAALEGLPISTDALTSSQAFVRTINLARTYRLTGYDAAYLELAIRYRIPLATLDKKLRKAADKAGVEIYLEYRRT